MIIDQFDDGTQKPSVIVISSISLGSSGRPFRQKDLMYLQGDETWITKPNGFTGNFRAEKLQAVC